MLLLTTLYAAEATLPYGWTDRSQLPDPAETTANPYEALITEFEKTVTHLEDVVRTLSGISSTLIDEFTKALDSLRDVEGNPIDITAQKIVLEGLKRKIETVTRP